MTKVYIRPFGSAMKSFDTKTYAKAIRAAGNESAKAVEVDFHVTTQTWKHKPAFKIENISNQAWVISTDDPIYGYVSLGTRPHIIKPVRAKFLRFYRTGFRPKSRPNWIGSNAGAKATRDLTAAKIVHHPGNAPRNFGPTISAKWNIEWPRQLARAIRAITAYGGK